MLTLLAPLYLFATCIVAALLIEALPPAAPWLDRFAALLLAVMWPLLVAFMVIMAIASHHSDDDDDDDDQPRRSRRPA